MLLGDSVLRDSYIAGQWLVNPALPVPDWRKDILRWGVNQVLECGLGAEVSAKAIMTMTQPVEASVFMLLIGKNKAIPERR